jgi:hypothetical protein
MEEIVNVCKKTFTDAENQERAFGLENNLEDFKTKKIEQAEKVNELETIAKKGTKQEMEKVVHWLFSNSQYNRPDLLLEICDKYIKIGKPITEKEIDENLHAWEGLIKYTATIKGLDEANKLFESLKSKKEDYKAYAADYDKKIREISKDMRGLQNDYTDYLKNVKNNDPMAQVLQNYASVYNETHQYTDEVYTRKQLLNVYKLDSEKEQLQLFLLTMSYFNLGYFDNVKKTATLLKEKHPESTYVESVNSIVNFMPQ